MNNVPNIKEIKEHFEHINNLSAQDGGDHIVPFSDVQHYTEQIRTFYKVDVVTASAIAHELAQPKHN